MPRNASCVAGTAPSRLMATRENPVDWIRDATPRSISVPLVASAIRNPLLTP